MEIQFTIKLLGSGGNAAIPQIKKKDEKPDGHSLPRTFSALTEKPNESTEGSQKPLAEAGAAGDDPGPGGGGGVSGPVIVIGPIVINGAGDDPGPGGGGK